jgi:hypothetical protein
VTPETVTYRGDRAVVLLSDDIEVVVLPQRGAKIASLRHRPSGREWLLQPQDGLTDPPAYGSGFTQTEMFGWDEMLPTIDRTAYPDGEHRTTPLPDHGEVWALPWETSLAGEALICSTSGRALPYQVERTMRVEGTRLTLDYQLSAVGSGPLWLLWAAHPQFVAAVEGTRIVLPVQVNRLLNVWPSRPPKIVAWPSPDAESIAGVPGGGGRKFYALPDAAVATAGLVDADGPWLRLTWDPALVPYLGIWLDNGAFARQAVIALEPSTGYYDDLALAVSNQRVPQIHPGGPLRWSLEVSLGSEGGG